MSAAGMVVNDSQFAQESPDLHGVKRLFEFIMTPSWRQFELASETNTRLHSIFVRTIFQHLGRFFGLASNFSTVGIVCCFPTPGIVRPFNICVDLNSLFADRDVCGTRVDPSSAIKIIDAMFAIGHMHRDMSVPAEN